MSRMQLTADVEAELWQRVKVAAGDEDKSLSEWIEEAIRHELERDNEEHMSISRASVPAFQRDWDSEEDAVYDELVG